MSTRKAKRKYRDRVVAMLKDRMLDAQEDAEAFFETATPFEISRDLSALGVSTSDREGINVILLRAWDSSASDPLALRVPQLLRSLVECWVQEIRSKGREPVFEDKIFLTKAAEHFIYRLAGKLPCVKRLTV